MSSSKERLLVELAVIEKYVLYRERRELESASLIVKNMMSLEEFRTTLQ